MSEKSKETIIKVDPNGVMSFIYDDELADLLQEGTATVTRASHVEPVQGGEWQADMAPVGGPVLTGFKLRKEALAAEVKYLKTHLFGGELSGQ